MTLTEYQRRSRSFATGGGLTLEYAVLGLAEESGEVAGKVAKYIRKTNGRGESIKGDTEWREKLVAELGDCLWMVANASAALGIDLDEVAFANLNKLDGRRARGTIIGEGDVR